MPSISSVYMWSCVMMAMKLKLICLGLGVLKLEGAGAKLLGRATLRQKKLRSVYLRNTGHRDKILAQILS